MTKRYEVTWLTANTAEMDADSVEDAVAEAMRMAADGNIKRRALCDMIVKDCNTGKKLTVKIDQNYKVVKAHELD